MSGPTCQMYGSGVAVPCGECNMVLLDVEEYEALRARVAELEAANDRLRRGLTFYADGLHFVNGGDFDTVTGEADNWLCDTHGSTVEDGSMAAHVLGGGDIDDDIAEEDEP